MGHWQQEELRLSPKVVGSLHVKAEVETPQWCILIHRHRLHSWTCQNDVVTALPLRVGQLRFSLVRQTLPHVISVHAYCMVDGFGTHPWP